ncbi:ORF0 [Pepper enamovirus]|uniref:ORF0 n=1 Tax=Pepper enamovirus TaxID=2073163 RepID=A0A2I7UGC7_9VIRU|nr:ORF0 [Pepper enamovirus]AUS29452.1 ORF0 [Pepper enamovirus]
MRSCYAIPPLDVDEPVHSVKFLLNSLHNLYTYTRHHNNVELHCCGSYCATLAHFALVAYVLVWGHPHSRARRPGVDIEPSAFPRGIIFVGPPSVAATLRLYGARLGAVLPHSIQRPDGRVAISVALAQPFPTVLDWAVSGSGGGLWEFGTYAPIPIPGENHIADWVRPPAGFYNSLVVDLCTRGQSPALTLFGRLWSSYNSPSKNRRRRSLYMGFFVSCLTVAVSTPGKTPYDILAGSRFCSLVSMGVKDCEDLGQGATTALVGPLPVDAPCTTCDNSPCQSLTELELKELGVFYVLAQLEDAEEEEEGWDGPGAEEEPQEEEH